MTKNQETIDEIMRLRESGMKIQEIADHYGVNKERLYQIAGDELKAWNIENNPAAPKKKRKPDIRTIRKLMAEGKTVAEVADKLGVSKVTVYTKLRDDEARKVTVDDQVKNFGAVRGHGGLENRFFDPETGLVVEQTALSKQVIARMGDEKVTAFVQYHMEMLAMRQGVDKSDVNDLYNRFLRYLQYCQEHGIVPNNMNAYLAIGLNKSEVSAWRRGVSGTPEHKKFAEDISAFFASVHEQGGTDGVLNPISAMFWQKAHDNLIEASKLEVTTDDPLGEKRSAADIAKAYTEVELPD